MEGQGAGFRKELVSKLLCLHFRDKKTRVSTDAVQLMAEMLRIFVVGESLLRGFMAHQHGLTGLGALGMGGPQTSQVHCVAEAAVRGVRQAQAEDLPCVDVDQLEKVLPQLLLDF
ncbi:centromere protein X isoform X1 [Tenrec ecaudatus]|uniref:centromere protein X isoform X1 n=1 Tax=Tenrec ecaudatus TaxID=94439 RepID=UPI003F5A88DB